MESDGAGHDFYAAGQQLVFSRYDRTTQRYDLYTTAADGAGGAQRLTQTADISETLPAVSHDGLLLASRSFYHSPPPRDAIRIFQVGSWSLVREISLPPPAEINFSGIGFSRDDQRLFFSAQAAGVTAPNVQNRQEVFSIKIDGTERRGRNLLLRAEMPPSPIAPAASSAAAAPRR